MTLKNSNLPNPLRLILKHDNGFANLSKPVTQSLDKQATILTDFFETELVLPLFVRQMKTGACQLAQATLN